VIGVERIDFVTVPYTDRDRAVRFYGETLGIGRNELAHTSEDYPEFETGNVTLGLEPADRHPSPALQGREFAPIPWPIALRVPDVEAARARLEGEGVEFFGDTIDTGVCHMAFFADPDGNALMLHRRYASYGDGSTP
jgi:predicted enzyme related to lactoylglutathione lyase